MALINEDRLKAVIKSGAHIPCFIITGDDGYLKKMYVDKIAGAVADKNDLFNYSRFNSDCDLQDVYDSAVQLPVMADRKCNILCDYDFEHCAKSDFDRLCLLAEDNNDTAVLIIWFDALQFDVKKSARFKKLVAAAEKSGGIAAEINHRKTPELIKMLSDGAAKRGCRLDSATARYIVESVGDDINTLVCELEKLCFYNPGGIITKQTAELVCAKTVDASVYNLSKSILSLNADSALKLLDDLFFMKIEPITVLYSVSSAYVDMYRVFLCKAAGKTLKDAAEIFGYKGREFVLERAAANLSKLDKKRFSLSFDALVKCDNVLKSFGTDPRAALEQLIVRLIYIISKGESVDNT